MTHDRMPRDSRWRCAAWWVVGLALVGAGCEIKVAPSGPSPSPPVAAPSAADAPPTPSPDNAGQDSKAPEDKGPDSTVPSDATPGDATPGDTASAPAASKSREPLPIESTSRRAVTREAGIEAITFDDLNIGMQADMVFRDFLLTDRVKELDGRRIRLIGYIHGGVSQLKDLKEFVLLKNTECKFGPGGQADHLVRVLLQDGVSANYSTNAVQIEGVLKVAPFQGPDGNTWSVYDLIGDHFKTIRR